MTTPQPADNAQRLLAQQIFSAVIGIDSKAEAYIPFADPQGAGVFEYIQLTLDPAKFLKPQMSLQKIDELISGTVVSRAIKGLMPASLCAPSKNKFNEEQWNIDTKSAQIMIDDKSYEWHRISVGSRDENKCRYELCVVDHKKDEIVEIIPENEILGKLKQAKSIKLTSGFRLPPLPNDIDHGWELIRIGNLKMSANGRGSSAYDSLSTAERESLETKKMTVIQQARRPYTLEIEAFCVSLYDQVARAQDRSPN